jgi:ABC-type bacteriocin/lantibiotic exporter with double-glycine peptidase domain
MIFLRSFLLVSFMSLVTAASLQGQTLDSPLRCGAYCLYIGAKSFDKAPSTFQEFEEILGIPTSAGYSLLTLKNAAIGAGLQASCVKTTPELLELRQEPFACIAHLNGNHFVLLAGFQNDEVIVIDPPKEYRIPVKTLLSQWQGDALLISAAPLQSEESLSRRIWFQKLLVGAALSAGVIFVFGVSYRQFRKHRNAKSLIS